MKLNHLLQNIDYKLIIGDINININDIAYDSRVVKKNDIFICLKGYVTDGHKYIDNAINKGATAILISDDIDVSNYNMDNITLIKTSNTRKALATISSTYFNTPSKKLTTIAITGTKGKTTTVEMIRSILEKSNIKTGTIGTLGVVIGEDVYSTENTTPESYEVHKAMYKMVENNCKVMIIEASSQGLKWDRLYGIDFDYGIFTNLSPDHIGKGEHKDFTEYLNCKSMLFKQCKIGIVNADDKHWQNVTKNATCKIETFGFNNKADIYATNYKLISKPGYIGIHFETKGIKEIKINVAIPGHFSIYNGLAAICVCRHFNNVDDKHIYNGLNTIKVKGRVEAVNVPGDYTLLIDYAHNALSMENVLTTLREYKPNRLIVLFGAGGNRPKARRYEMGEVAGNLADLSIITEDNSRFENVMDIIEDIKTGIKKTKGEYKIIPNRTDAIKYCMSIGKPNDIIVLAGKGHETYQETNGVKHHYDEREVIKNILTDIKTNKE